MFFGKKIFLLAVTLVIFAAAFSQAQARPKQIEVEAPSLSLPLLIGLALVDAINPCVIGVLILMLTVLLKSGHKEAVLKNGLTYTAGVYLTYLIGGLTLLSAFNAVRSIAIVSQMLYAVVGGFIIVAGFVEVKDFFWYGKWFSLSIPTFFVKTAEKQARESKASLAAAFGAGVVLTLIELPCTGAPYLAVLTLMSQSGLGYLTALPMLLLYNLVFVLPLVAIILLAYTGFKLEKLDEFRKHERGLARLLIGVALVTVGIWVVAQVYENAWLPLAGVSAAAIALMAVEKKLFPE